MHAEQTKSTNTNEAPNGVQTFRRPVGVGLEVGMEVWKTVNGYEGLYEVSDMGSYLKRRVHGIVQ